MKTTTAFLFIFMTWASCLGLAQSSQYRINSIPFKLEIKNNPRSISTSGDSILELASFGKTNMFANPNNKSNVQDAPMVLFQPDSSFVFCAKVSAQLKEVYDVAALIVYQDSSYWSKFCFENSVNKQPTIVSVVTQNFSDDCNSFHIEQKNAYLAIIKSGLEMSFHYSADGKNWELIRHFRLETDNKLKVGFAVHGSRGEGFAARFSNIHYSPKVPDNLRSFR